jgi:hypothetical protein
MRNADIPLEGTALILSLFAQLTQVVVMWNDIDLYHAVRDFTSDPVTYPREAVRAFTTELVIYSVASSNYSIHSIFRLRTIRNARYGITSLERLVEFSSFRYPYRRCSDT